ncbi:hypothetical protein PROFUN_16651, partial [Planoprotostelium fungivorum]
MRWATISCVMRPSVGFVEPAKLSGMAHKSLVAECPHDNLMAEAEEEQFSDYRVVNCHFQLNTQASTSLSPNMPPKAFETPA